MKRIYIPNGYRRNGLRVKPGIWRDDHPSVKDCWAELESSPLCLVLEDGHSINESDLKVQPQRTTVAVLRTQYEHLSRERVNRTWDTHELMTRIDVIQRRSLVPDTDEMDRAIFSDGVIRKVWQPDDGEIVDIEAATASLTDDNGEPVDVPAGDLQHDLENPAEIVPDETYTNDDIREWLRDHGADYKSNDTKADLLERVNEALRA